MKVPNSNERDLISRIARRLRSSVRGKAHDFVQLGIGDDAAVLRTRPGRELVLTCDFSLGGRHFLPNVHSPDAIGWKSLARATSDIAAMGAEPRCFLLSLALPRNLTGKWLDDFLGGMARAAQSFGLIAAGGDTTLHEKVIVNITVAGQVPVGRAITRAGAQPGDLICVSGGLGEAQLGFELLQCRFGGAKQPSAGKQSRIRVVPQASRTPFERALQKHLYPEPRLALGQWLAKNRLATAMIDTSDGLSTDLAHLCEASGVGARLFADKIPVVMLPLHTPVTSAPIKPAPITRTRSASGKASPNLRNLDALELALHCGEDYELLFTVPPSAARRLPPKHHGIPITIIGEVTRGNAVTIHNQPRPSRLLIPQGWDPFAKKNH